MDPVSLRMFERIIDVVIGGVSIYLGYSLFIHLPDLKDSKGEFTMPGKVSVYLSRIGPGVFFALFGTTVVLLSLYSPIVVTPEGRLAMPVQDPPVTDTIGQPAVSFSGVTEGSTQYQSFDELRVAMQRDVMLLNQMVSDLDTGLSDDEKRDFRLAQPRIKLAMLESIWDEQVWGDRVLFREWVENGAADAPPSGTEQAAEFFNFSAEGAGQ